MIDVGEWPMIGIKGFGLGLYYVSNIIKKHGGDISVHSKLQSGTEFTITLPKNT